VTHRFLRRGFFLRRSQPRRPGMIWTDIGSFRQLSPDRLTSDAATWLASGLRAVGGSDVGDPQDDGHGAAWRDEVRGVGRRSGGVTIDA